KLTSANAACSRSAFTTPPSTQFEVPDVIPNVCTPVPLSVTAMICINFVLSWPNTSDPRPQPAMPYCACAVLTISRTTMKPRTPPSFFIRNAPMQYAVDAGVAHSNAADCLARTVVLPAPAGQDCDVCIPHQGSTQLTSTLRCSAHAEPAT